LSTWMMKIVDDTTASRARPLVLDHPPAAHFVSKAMLPIEGSMLLPSAKIAAKSL